MLIANVGSVVFYVVVGVVILGAVVLTFTTSRRNRRSELEPPMRPDAESSRGGTALLEPPIAESEVSAPASVTIESEAPAAEPEAPVAPAAEPEVVEPEAPPATYRGRLERARSALAGALGSLRGRERLDDEAWDDLEEALIRADVGVSTTQQLLDAVRGRVKEEGITTPDGLLDAVKTEMRGALLAPIDLRMAASPPTIWLFVGVNGVGKTTTIGKLGKRMTDQGHRVVMAAGDTFRAAAAEQLGTWAERCGAELVRGAEGGDPSAVIFDGVAHAAASGADLVLADTAGRLHTKTNLMDELRKVRRVADKGEGEVAEVLLVIDATTGQNGLNQARQFTEAVEVTGVVLTKLDGSAKGGIVLAIHSELGIPVKLVGLGESAGDLVDFDAEQFVDALF